MGGTFEEGRIFSEAERQARRTKRRASREGTTFQAFLRYLERVGGMDEARAREAAVSVLCALEQRISAGEGRHLRSQLPRKLQAMLTACKTHGNLPARHIDCAAFLSFVGEDLELDPADAEQVVRAVFESLVHQVSAGEIDEVVHQLPAKLRALWPETVRSRVEAKLALQGRLAQRSLLPTSRPGSPRERTEALRLQALALPLPSQLGLLRALAPQVIGRLERGARAGFLRDLEAELAQAERGSTLLH